EKRPDGTERVRFRPTPPHLVAPQVEGLCERYGTARGTGQEPLVLVPLAILDFLCIHPFRDGNGRVARLISLMLLYQAGYEVGRYISLERVIEQSKETYYETLEASSQGWHEGRHDVMPWLDYFWGMLLRAYGEFEERLERATAGGLCSNAERVRAAVLRRSAPFRLAEIHEECEGVSRETVRNVLRQMRDEGLVTVSGTGRGAQWQRNRTGREDG
ncbi:MAG: Fic family protein, partial [Thiohalorhabdaceae bacterium]